ncbi:uncharacterized protein LOC133197077 [Saccostrea echinata]|uniref:uncharacterized protein LOC133197077 n=1 Tax=Saccostrea echinata TaxID=191078 RepID=UPI002A7F0CDE|nr:uncharacterized protein LOC133197077 [Saccostrea echinata]
MEDKNDAEDKVGSRLQRYFEMQIQKEKQKLERRVLQLFLEGKLYSSNIEMESVKARVSELLLTNRQLNARITAMENKREVSETKKDINAIVDKNFKKSTKSSVLSKGNSVQVSSLDSTAKSEKFVKAQQNLSITENTNQPTKLKLSHKPNQIQKLAMAKRLLTGVHTTKPPFADGVAFSAFVSTYETEISKDHTIKFDIIVSNIGNHYNLHSGIFTSPQHGVYVFTWNLYCRAGGYIFSQILVNSNAVGGMLTSSNGATSFRTTTGVVVMEVNQGDVVFVRIHSTETQSGNLFSHPDYRSSFNGWKIY